jgi:Regulator of Chromosome Condensation (RCC1) repeat protein
MKKDIFDRLTLIVGIGAIVLTGIAQRASAQKLLSGTPIPGYTLTLPSPNDLVEITAGWAHTCVRKYGGAVYCWGVDDNGQVGTSATRMCADSSTTSRPCVDFPAYVTTLSTLGSQIVAANAHTCALSGGIPSCWGSNALGELGDGTNYSRSMPQNVSGFLQFSRLAGGDWSTCGLTVGQSAVYCWGLQPYDPTKQPGSSTVPKQLYSGSGFSNLTVGNGFVCFVYIVGGWGENDCQGVDSVGQLGVVSTPGTPDAPSWMPRDNYGTPFINTTVLSSIGVGTDGVDRVARSSAGSYYVCGDVTDGTVQCVGSNSAGQLGTTGGNRADARAVVNASGSTLQLHGVTTGSTHACALDASGYAWCWGGDTFGELGNNTSGANFKYFYAVQVAGNIKFRSLAAGTQHTCGIGTDNYVYCWGDNTYGQLGVGINNIGMNSSGFGFATHIGTPQKVAAF